MKTYQLNITNIQAPEIYYGFVFITYFPNGMIYVGQTAKRVDENYFGSGGCDLIEAIKLCGKENLKREILRFCYTNTNLNGWENFHIVINDATNKTIGYNKLPGAPCKFNPMTIPECVEKLSNSMKVSAIGNKNRLGMSTTLEGKLNMSIAQKNRAPMSDETKNRMLIANRKRFDNGQIGNTKDMIRINNGIVDMMILKNQKLPRGFKLGMKPNKKYKGNTSRKGVKITNETRLKQSIANKEVWRKRKLLNKN